MPSLAFGHLGIWGSGAYASVLGMMHGHNLHCLIISSWVQSWLGLCSCDYTTAFHRMLLLRADFEGMHTDQGDHNMKRTFRMQILLNCLADGVPGMVGCMLAPVRGIIHGHVIHSEFY